MDSWTPEQLKMMVYGGNNRAQAFFKQHGWTDGGKIEAKYTSRAADLYRQLLAKEVAKSSTEDGNNSWPSSPVAASQAPNQAAAFPDLKLTEVSKENVSEKKESEIVHSPRAPTHSFKKPIGAKKPGNKTGGLGARKLTSKVCLIQCKLHLLENTLSFGPVSLHIVVICQVTISVLLFCTVTTGS